VEAKPCAYSMVTANDGYLLDLVSITGSACDAQWLVMLDVRSSCY
jgi:hypothetical protein